MYTANDIKNGYGVWSILKLNGLMGEYDSGTPTIVAGNIFELVAKLETNMDYRIQLVEDYFTSNINQSGKVNIEFIHYPIEQFIEGCRNYKLYNVTKYNQDRSNKTVVLTRQPTKAMLKQQAIDKLTDAELEALGLTRKGNKLH